ncbi:MAG: class I SAM-dependent methyltransferase, partial [Alphaproteobacteria bacterium]|nr:class I SAM-dependent methyltransferase [Alphaproteobacteria bacterium]
MEKARANITQLGLSNCVKIIKEKDEVFLKNCTEMFDFIYIDTSHDYDSVKKLIALAVGLLSPMGVVGGDDFSDEGTWGVKSAVNDSFTQYDLHEEWLWLGKAEHFRTSHMVTTKNIPPELPIHFFTIVLNGMPFIKYHFDILQQLPFKWHWHIVEGVADLVHDTAWSKQLGGQISNEFHHLGLSIDGTTDYLDRLKQRFPDQITVYRKPKGSYWDGKLEMVNAPLSSIKEECLLWQIDVDEYWTVEQIETARRMFSRQPEKTAAYYWCHFFVGK